MINNIIMAGKYLVDRNFYGAALIFSILTALILLIISEIIFLFFFRDQKNASKKLLESKKRLKYLAYHDTLTGLLNKQSLYENCSSIFRDNMGISALLFVDMDQFKYVNDAMGHSSGDSLIVKVGERLNSLLKEGCLLYRFGGDEFVIIINNIKERQDAEVFASYIVSAFKEEFGVLNSNLHITLSIGVAVYPEHGQDVDEILKNADIAMYRAKEAGRNRYVMFDPSMNEVLKERSIIEQHLHAALSKNEFEIYYQPQVNAKTKDITGFEALLRWNSPELGPVSPMKFIKVAEDTHLIIQLGAWVLRNSCAFLKKLHKAGRTGLSVSVNISILQLIQADFFDMVLNTLECYDLKPEFLELEITETILIESFETIGSKLKSLKETGVRIALDDFGKGYSSLSYLRQLPISTIKIDKSFVDCIADETMNKVLIGQIVVIGKSMKMSVVAEGVESQEQMLYLLESGCDTIQGYLYYKPLPEFEVLQLLGIN